MAYTVKTDFIDNYTITKQQNYNLQDMKRKDLRIVFMGTPDFAVESLKILVENNYDIVGVITAPDRPAGRGQKLSESAVKKYAVSQGLRILQPTNLKDDNFVYELRKLNANLQVVVAFRMLPEVVWNMPEIGTFNLHASLLPQYRGAAPINWAIINGEKKSGVTTFFLDHKIDTGKIIMQEEVEIANNDSVGTYHDKLMVTGSELLLKTVDAIAADNVKPVPQKELFKDESELKHAPKIFKDDCLVNWDDTIDNIQNKIRGLNPYPTAWTNVIDESEKKYSLKIFETEVEKCTHDNNHKEIITDGKTYFKIALKEGYLKINSLQIQGKKRMNTEDFLRGFRQKLTIV